MSLDAAMSANSHPSGRWVRTQPRFGSDEEARGKPKQEKEARLHGAHEGRRALI